MFSRDAAMCRFFDAKDGESLLAEIERKNEAEGMGNTAIPNTGIRLINAQIQTEIAAQNRKVQEPPFKFTLLGKNRPFGDRQFVALRIHAGRRKNNDKNV